MEQEALPQAARSSTAREPDTHGWNLVLNSPIFFRIVPARCAGGTENRVAAHRKGAPFFLSVAMRSGAVSGVFLPPPWPGPGGGDTARGCEWHVRFLYAPVGILPGKLIFVFVKFFLFCTVAVSTLLELIRNREIHGLLQLWGTSKAFVIYLHCPQGCFGDGRRTGAVRARRPAVTEWTTLSH